MNRILIVEDKDSLRAVLRKTLESEGYRVEEAADASEALHRLRAGPYLMVLTDLKLPKGDGHQVLKAALEEDPLLPVVVMTAYGTVEDAVRAMKEGAFDFLSKPVDTAHLLLQVERASGQRRLVEENILLKEEFAQRFGMPRIVGDDPNLKSLTDQVRRVAPTGATVLLCGESGTGKELFARALHELSPRSGRPFVAINCAAIPETLLENELFAARSSWTRSASSPRPFRPRCCASFKRKPLNEWEERPPSPWTCASSPQPTKISSVPWRRRPSARTCTSGSPSFLSPYPLSGSARGTSRSWWNTSSPASRES